MRVMGRVEAGGSPMKILEWTDIDNIDDAQESKELNACYIGVGDTVVRVYLNHESYKAYAESSDPAASKEALLFLCNLGYEPVIRE